VVARLGTVRFRQQTVWSLAYSPDGKVLASAGYDNQVRLWEPATGKELGRLAGHQSYLQPLAFSRDGALLATGSADKTVRLWDVATRKQLRVMRGHRWTVDAVAFSPDGKLLASGGMDNTVRVWEVATGKEVRRFGGGPSGHYTHVVAFSPDGKLLVSAGTEKVVRRWEVDGWKELKDLQGHQDRIVGLAFTPDGKRIATCSFDKTVRLWGVDSRMQWRLAEEPELVRCLALSPDGKRVAAGDIKGTLAVWDTGSGRELARWKADRDCLVALTFSPDGQVLASAAPGSDIRLWRPTTGKRLNPTTAPIGAVRHLAFSPDGKCLAAAGGGRMNEAISLWNVGAWKERGHIAEPGGRVRGIAFSADGKVLASAQANPGAICLWDADTGKPGRRLPGRSSWLEGLAVSPGGTDLAWLDGRELVFGDLTTGKERLRVKSRQYLRQVAYSPNGRLVVAASDNALHLWDTVSGEELRTFGQRRLGTHFLVFSPDGRTLVTPAGPAMPGGPGSEVCLWETATGAERGRLRGHEGWVDAATFSPDGRLLATSSRGERAARLWDAFTGAELRRLEGHRGDVHALAFSPDGQLLAAGDSDSTVLIWDVPALVRPRPRPAGALGARELNGLWGDLAGQDAPRAYRAVVALADHPGQAGPFLRDAVKGTPVGDGKRLSQLIAELDADAFAAREKASKELAALGASAGPALKEALRNKPSPEAARRLRELLKKMNVQVTPLETVRALRAVEALERISTPPAREALRVLAENSADPDVVREARASLRRLSTRRQEGP
jgi:WD40 repeat protein